VQSQSIHFFATKDDLSAVLIAVEARLDVSYVECGLFDAADTQTFSTFQTLPDFYAAGARERRFLVLLGKCHLSIREVPQRRGGVKYAVDQLANPGTAVLKPGVEFNESLLIAGDFGTVHNDEDASLLIQAFATEVNRGFEHIKSYWVGPEARTRIECGARLTSSVHSPKDYDLTMG